MLNNKWISKLMAERRKAIGLSQRKLAKDAGISGAYMSQLERGDLIDISRHVFFSIFNALGASEKITTLIFNGRMTSGKLLKDGSLAHPSGLIYSPSGVIDLPSGSKLVDLGPKFLESRFVIELPNGSTIPGINDDNARNIGVGELPTGAYVDRGGNLRLPGTPVNDLSDEEVRLIRILRQLSGPKRQAAIILLESLACNQETYESSQTGHTPEHAERQGKDYAASFSFFS